MVLPLQINQAAKCMADLNKTRTGTRAQHERFLPLQTATAALCSLVVRLVLLCRAVLQTRLPVARHRGLLDVSMAG